MTVNIDEEVKVDVDFDYKSLINQVIEKAADYVECPYEINVNILIVDNDTIHQINLENRDIDRPTDVLSFPMLEYEEPADFDYITDELIELFEPDTGELMLGDIVLSIDKVKSQAEEYNHSVKREMAFLVVHSMLHLFGYDHMEEDGTVMEEMQEDILKQLDITRD